jgi:hypothetical protein
MSKLSDPSCPMDLLRGKHPTKHQDDSLFDGGGVSCLNRSRVSCNYLACRKRDAFTCVSEGTLPHVSFWISKKENWPDLAAITFKILATPLTNTHCYERVSSFGAGGFFMCSLKPRTTITNCMPINTEDPLPCSYHCGTSVSIDHRRGFIESTSMFGLFLSI